MANIRDLVDSFRNSPAGELNNQASEAAALKIPVPDTRTRSERREDFEKELAKLDKASLERLRDRLNLVNRHTASEELMENKEDIEAALTKFITYIDKFEKLNSDEARKIALKKEELRLAARHDWAEKGRTFLFRVFASCLLIATLFAIGYIEKEYDWAVLPLSKYVKPPVVSQ